MQDIVNENIVSFINSFDKGDSVLCGTIEKEARDAFVPIIRKETGAFLKTLLALTKPRRILEIGAAVGYSALLMSENTVPDSRITTIENYPPRILAARENFRRAGKEDAITLLEGDAAEVLKTLSGEYDFIFMDAAKAQYIMLLPDVIRLLAKGGLLLADNVLQEGEITKPRFGVTRRNRTIYERMREYLYAVTHCEELQTSIVPIGDGVTVSVRL